MAEKIAPNLNDPVAVTLLIPLYIRAMESQCPDALIRDEKAAAIVQQMDCDFSKLRLRGMTEPATVLRIREFDRMAREFLARNPRGVVVHIGCGLDTRFERVDNGQAEWFDLDLTEVIDLRRSLLGSDGGRYHQLGCSVFENAWLEALEPYRDRAILFMAEGVLPYFEEAQVKKLVLALCEHFPGAELVCDGISPLIRWTDNLKLAMTRVKARIHWGLRRGKDLEGWAPGISLLEEWFFFDHPEPRMEKYSWFRHVPVFAKGVGIYHYQLGSRP